MPEFAPKKTADIDSLGYSAGDPYYKTGPVQTCLYVRVRETGDWDLFQCPLACVRTQTGELTEGCYSGGDFQGLPGFSNPRILGIPTISLIYTIYFQNKKTKNTLLFPMRHLNSRPNTVSMIQICHHSRIALCTQPSHLMVPACTSCIRGCFYTCVF